MKYTTDTELITALQTRLKALRYYTGQLDGEQGALTANAIILFKKANNLRPRAFVGPKTLHALFCVEQAPRPKPSLPSNITAPPNVAEAIDLLGVREFRGAANNPTIMEWAKDLDQWYPGDDTAWCGLFIAHCEATAFPEEPQDFNRLGAREWLKYGVKSIGRLGDVAVFWRGSPTGWKGHVAYVLGLDNETYHVLGGNQSDSVSVTRISRHRLLGFRRAHRLGVRGYDKLTEPYIGNETAISTNEA